ncbi:ribonuclease T [Ostreibacterium oceani]|uniref:Ribonuclease T n=1 Tax=Ostreibacterium oceani TaxID=2654998 RepID=A0A6N7EZ61_9GAMM|nr:ribonuclease T [Ostreibacterium oceani]MPV86649.1 ribonuclease T [Ostreibacterium oceani]
MTNKSAKPLTANPPIAKTAIAKTAIAKRFRGFLPVVVDLETGGFDANKHALLELAAVVLDMDERGNLFKKHTIHAHVKPFAGASIDPAALQVNGIVPNHPLRIAKDEKQALTELFSGLKKHLAEAGCSRAIMVAHNAMFDLGFLQAAVARCQIKDSPFHSFSTFDTVTLGGVMTGQTVLSRIAEQCGLDYDTAKAHGAKYDAELTADIFCQLVNRVGFSAD